ESVKTDLLDVLSVLPKADSSPALALIEDVYKLASDFLSYSDYGRGRLHLRVVNNDGCTKFHTDNYTLRLFTTYVGKGTEWLPESAVNRTGLGKGNEHVVKNQTMIERMRPFEVGLLKGEIKNRSITKGIVHRSPKISHTGEKRIILRIDI
ncbi:MAG: DUF1826 domain-containing protein, partial [Bacteroidota bacterium]